MNKRLTVTLFAVLLCVSLTACSLRSPDKSKGNDDEGFKSSDEVIEAFWQAFSDVRKSKFRECFPDPDEAKRGSGNIDELIDESYKFAKDSKDIFTVDHKGITIDSESFDVDDIDNGLDKGFDIEKAKISTVTVPLDKNVDGTIYKIEDIYEVITVRIDGNWYISSIEEIDVRAADD